MYKNIINNVQLNLNKFPETDRKYTDEYPYLLDYIKNYDIRVFKPVQIKKKKDEMKEKVKLQNLYFRCSLGNFYFINNPCNIYNEDKDEIECISLLEIKNYYKVFEWLLKIERKTSK